MMPDKGFGKVYAQITKHFGRSVELYRSSFGTEHESPPHFSHMEVRPPLPGCLHRKSPALKMPLYKLIHMRRARQKRGFGQAFEGICTPNSLGAEGGISVMGFLLRIA